MSGLQEQLTWVSLAYLLLIIGIGIVARLARRKENLGEFYLANRGLGTFVLLMTLYATQYSGNALVGYPGAAYRTGFAWVMSVGFMTAIVVVYLSFAPRLQHVARVREFITPADWIRWRFKGSALSAVANAVFVLALANYLLAQLMAMGHITVILSGGTLPFWTGVLGLGFIVLVYETLGGMRAVAWTDCIQGLILLTGLGLILASVLPGPGGLADTTRWIIDNAPDKAAVPGADVLRNWFSSIVLIGIGAAVYPQAIQRIFAARDTRALKRSLTFMAAMPLMTVFPVFLIGLLAIPRFTGLDALGADEVMPRLLMAWGSELPGISLILCLVLVAAMAAIMSTADSVLLSLSSILSKDVLGETLLRDADNETLTRWGKRLSWLLMAVLMLLAVNPRITLWGLIELKMEMLIQTAPLFILGANWKRFDVRSALAGLVAGLAVASVLTLTGYAKVAGIHAGVIGLGVNLLVIVASTSMTRTRTVAETAG